tara:strand:- start:3725 stop:5782 length:2058 start_codon:yes stop_codon:yes gene_type:complete
MSIKSIIKNAGQANIAGTLEKEKLSEIAAWVCKGHSDDLKSMDDWSKMLKGGLDIAKPELKGTDQPWENASNYKSPLIGEAVRNFGDRASNEVMRSKDLASVDIIGEKTPEKEELANRISTHMNYQLNYEIPGWRKQQGRALYGLAATGARIKKVFYDSTIGGVNSEWIAYPNFSLNNKCNDFAELDRFTHIRRYTDNDIFTKKKSGEWSAFDVENDESGKDDESETSFYTFLECYCLYDIDDDEYAEPYIITVHEQSKTVVRIAPRYDKGDVYAKYNDKVMSADYIEFELKKEYSQNELMDDEEKEKFTESETAKEFGSAELVRIDARNMLSLYNFTIPIDDTLLGYGFIHLMASPVKGVNKATNALFNAGDLSNNQSGFLSKEHRDKRVGPVKSKPGLFRQTSIAARDLQSSIMMDPIKEPSMAFIQINEMLKAEISDIGTKVNIAEALSPNVPAISVLGMLQEGIVPTTALMSRIIDSMTDEFSIIASLNAIYTDPLEYDSITGQQQSDAAADYGSKEILIKPTANAQFSSQAQRLQLAQIEMEYMPNVMQTGGNAAAIVRNFYDIIGSNVEEYFPKDGKMTDADKKANEQMMALQKQQQDIAQEQQRLTSAQLDLAQQSQDLKGKEADQRAAKDREDQRIDMIKIKEDGDIRISALELELTKLEAKYNKDLSEALKNNQRE